MTAPPPLDPPAEAPPPELHRPLALDRIAPHGLTMVVTATPEECAALAVRLRIQAVHALSCRFHLHKLPGGKVAAEGALRARITQTCVVSLDEFTADLTERFAVRFVPSGTETDDDLAASDLEAEDEIPYDGVFIDPGEAAAEQLALALDPYPRKPDATLPETAADPDISPFAALAARRRKT